QQAGGRMWCSAGPGVEPAGGWMWSTTSAPSGRGGARTGPGQEAHVARVSRCAGVSELGPWRPASSKVLFLRGKEGPWRHGGQPSSSSVTSSSAGRSSLCVGYTMRSPYRCSFSVFTIDAGYTMRSPYRLVALDRKWAIYQKFTI
uniref:Uncharacterized protein n=1 Tax=Aegilops tauschii subsp. strangulata TaxID=200361 RepID=A0A452Y5P2_AEGTS